MTEQLGEQHVLLVVDNMERVAAAAPVIARNCWRLART